MTRTDLVRDIVGTAGCGLISAGVALIYAPAGLIVTGLLMLAGAWLSARAG